MVGKWCSDGGVAVLIWVWTRTYHHFNAILTEMTDNRSNGFGDTDIYPVLKQAYGNASEYVKTVQIHN